MKYLGLIIFCMVFMIVYIIARAISFSNRNIEKKRRNFLDTEARANATRRADISSLDYISIDYSRLPMDAPKDSKLLGHLKELKSLESKRIIDLSGYSNTELKLMYGPANLEDLSSYDENYTVLIRSLDALGNGLIEAGDIASGTIFLEYAVEIGSDLTNTYMGLSDIYVCNNDKASLKELIKAADKITSLLGSSIRQKLEDKLLKM